MNQPETFIRLFSVSGKLIGLRRRATIERLCDRGRCKLVGVDRARLLSDDDSGKQVESGGHWYKRQAQPGIVSVAQWLFNHKHIPELDEEFGNVAV